MIQGEGGNARWARVQTAEGGPKTDFFNLGQFQSVGFFMHFSTITGNYGDKAYLESRFFYPKRGFQCLQFYHYNSGATDDHLNIWVREYTDDDNPGALRFIQNISETYPYSKADYKRTTEGGFQHSWELYHVSLDVSHKFRVVFEGVKGRNASKGGLSLDDINLSETQCPHHIWRIRNFTNLLATTPIGSGIFSPPILSREGYSFQVSLYINGRTDSPDKMAIFFHLTSGPHDDYLQWPCPWRQASMEMMEQNSDIQKRMNNLMMVTTDPTKNYTNSRGNVKYFWDNPRKVGSLITDKDGNSYYRGRGYGTSSFISHEHMKSRTFIKGDDVIFLLSLEDAGLLETWKADLRSGVDDSPNPSTGSATVTVAISVFVAAVAFLGVAVSVSYYVRRVRKRGQMEKDGEIELERTDGR